MLNLRCPLLLLALILGSGCKPSTPETPASAQPFAGQNVEVVFPQGHGFAAAWEIILQEWSARTGATYTLTEYDSAADDLVAALGPTPETGARLLIVPISSIAELASKGLLAAIPQSQLATDALDWNDLFFGLRENIASVERQPTVVPIASPVLVCYYRRDLLEQAGLQPPQTWQEYQTLLETRDDWASGLPVVEPWGPDFRTTMFLARAASYARHPENYSVWFDIATGDPLIDGPGFVTALQEAQQALEQMPEKVKTYRPADCRREFLAGRAALAVSYETADRELIPTADVETAGRPETMRVGVVRLPGVKSVYNRSTEAWESVRGQSIHRAGLTAFAGLCGGVDATQPDSVAARAAWNLLDELTGEQLATAFPGDTKSLCRESQYGSAAQWLGDDLSAEEFALYFDAVAQTLRDPQVVAELPVVGHTEFRAALTEALTAVIDGQVTPEAALQQAAERFGEILEKLGPDTVRNSYRRSLGLPPSSALR